MSDDTVVTPRHVCRIQPSEHWLGGIVPAWTLLDPASFDALRMAAHHHQAAPFGLRPTSHPTKSASRPSHATPSSCCTAASAGLGLKLTTTGNLSRSVVAEMCDLFTWPGFDKAEAFRFHKVINEPDFLPLFLIRHLLEAGKARAQRRKDRLRTTQGWPTSSRKPGARYSAGASVQYCLLGHRSVLLQPRIARRLAAMRHRYRALVAVGFCNPVGIERAPDPPLHDPGQRRHQIAMGTPVLMRWKARCCAR